ncbi:uncharacterized protein LOC113344958 [Papaver somniferum]|uniref:uncharacterized protein LOC113344958 n=1 Tax=Papaver somniferum TaxID=3469 RepID=UPI000E6F7418|nr:uncharacterized protein LOC113344958 [Papaver somniferum]XP_026444615.1 uncharacterized protein LOC113344958 [Papaver somniferum]
MVVDLYQWNAAVRAKELAEKKMNSKDYVGARTMLVEAQKLYPDVENVTQMLTVCQVHCSAERKKELGSDLDWYAILQIEQTADEVSIKKKFRNLALQLHPDKNKFPGAEAAFKFIKDAERILCDKSKRSQFDMKRDVMQHRQSQNQPSMNDHPSQHSVSTDFSSLFKRMETHLQKQQQANGQQTFWTQCPSCRIRYQYYTDAMNRVLRCQHCSKTFIALNNQGMPYGVNSRPVPPKADAPTQADQKIQGNRGNVTPVSQAPTVSGRAPKPKAEEDVNVHVEVEVKEKSVPAEPTPPGTKNRKRGRNSVTEKETESLETESSCDMEEDCDHEAGQNSGLNSGRDTRRSSWRKHDVSYKENLGDEDDTASRSRRKTTKISKPVDKVKKDKRKVLEESTPDGIAENCKNNGEEVAEDDGNSEGPEPVVAEVVYPDFYSFDRDRTEECFALDQIWAIFDSLDGMPRFYARINKVYSPFKVELTWLEFVADDPDQTAWKTDGLPFACGKFKLEKTDTVKEIGTFSHKMVCEKGVQDTYKIYPRKWETWALYKNWNIKWSSDRDYHREYEYEFVVVLSDYVNKSGILVSQLVKLKGFVCSFKATETNGMYTFQIPSNEMLKFSHRVPSVRTNGYFELDPASLSSNLEEVSDFIDGEAEILGGRKHRSLKSILKKKPHEENVEESKNLSTSDGVTAKDEILGGKKQRSLKSIFEEKPHAPKNVNEENVEESKNLSTSDGVTAKDEILGGTKQRSLKSIFEEKPHAPKNVKKMSGNLRL